MDTGISNAEAMSHATKDGINSLGKEEKKGVTELDLTEP